MEKTADFTEGRILSRLLRFALPVLAALFLQAMYGAVDLMVVGQFGAPTDVSAVSTGSQIMQTVTSLITGLAMGITILVGQKIGEKRPEQAGDVIGSGICLFGVLAAVLTVLMILGAGFLAGLMHAPDEASRSGPGHGGSPGGQRPFVPGSDPEEDPALYHWKKEPAV